MREGRTIFNVDHFFLSYTDKKVIVLFIIILNFFNKVHLVLIKKNMEHDFLTTVTTVKDLFFSETRDRVQDCIWIKEKKTTLVRSI